MNRNFAGNVGTGGKSAFDADFALIDDVLLTDKEVCAMLNCARSTLWRWAAEGIVPKPLKIGGMSRWRKSKIYAVIHRAEALAA